MKNVAVLLMSHVEAKQAGAKLTLEFEGKAIGCSVPRAVSCVLEYSIDGKPYKKLDTYTQWSAIFIFLGVYVETELPDTKHKLVLRISKEKNDASKDMSYKYGILWVN